MKEKNFYPDYLAEILLVILICLEIILIYIFFFPINIGQEIDFIRPYQPRPEWYFLWVFELLKYFHGSLLFVGAIVIPLIFALTIMFIPYIDKKIGRTKTIWVASTLLSLFVLLTILGMV